MKFPETETAESMYITVLVTREEHPRLFSTLQRIPKGKRRAARLRALASAGILFDEAPATSGTSRLARQAVPHSREDSADTLAAAQMFAEPILDD